MNLLDAANITIDAANMPIEHWLALIFLLAAVVIVVFAAGFSVKIGDKELNVGGVMRLLAKRDGDSRLKEDLKRFADETDHEITADLYDLIEDIDTRMDRVLVEGHCYFTLEKFTNLIKKELQKRVRRNNLREKLAEGNREKYTAKVLRDVEERYDLFRAKAAGAACNDAYADFSAVREMVGREIGLFFDRAKAALVCGMRKKRERYRADAPKFKTAAARKFCCGDPSARNKAYIENLTGTEEPA